MKTQVAKLEDITRDWFVIDAEGLILGRLAAFIATRLRGKHKPYFTPSIDCGDNIIVINSGKLVMTGNKFDNKIHYRHTGYPGGIKEKKYGEILKSNKPEELIMLAVKRMMPKGTLARQQIKKLYVYGDEKHPHSPQKPVVIDLNKFNDKNKRGSVAANG